MELKLLAKDKDQVKVEFEAVDESIVHLFTTELLKNKDVKEATYSKEHMEEDKHIISLRMKKGRPITAMKKVAESLSEEFKQCRQMLQRALKSKPK